MSHKRKDTAGRPPKTNAFAYRPFLALKDLAAALNAPPPASPERSARAPRQERPENSPTTMSDQELFWREMQGVKRLWPEGANIVERGTPAQQPRPQTGEDAEVLAELADLVAGAISFDVTLSDEYVEGVVAGLDLRLLQRLRRGEFAYQGYVDLHGLTAEEAKVQVDNFLTAAMRTGKRCVLIVHGRGKNSKDQVPVLKTRVTEWLARGRWSRLVLAFCSARPCDGGTGALYVLLRRQPRERGKVRVATGVKW